MRDINEVLLHSTFIKQKGYWGKKLSSQPAGTEFKPYHEVLTGRKEKTEAGNFEIIFSPTLCAQLIRFGKGSELSIYIVLLAVLKILVYRFSGNTEVTVISPVYTPNISENTLNNMVFIYDVLDPDMPFIEVVLEVRQSLLEAYENQDYPSGKLMESLFTTEQLKNNPGFSNIICLWDNIHDLRMIKEIEVKDKIVFSFKRESDRILGNIRCPANIFDENFISRFSSYYAGILENSLGNINTKIGGLSFLTGEENRQLLEVFNRTQVKYPLEKTIHQLFEEQAEKTPDAVAAVGTSQVTYRRLNKQSRQLAGSIRAKSPIYHTIVGLKVERSIEMIVGILGILKAGNVYLPIDPGNPAERIQYILKDSGAQLLLTDESKSEESESLDIANLRLMRIDGQRQLPSHVIHVSMHRKFPSAGPLNPAYIIYTSGTTGQPRGVMVEHRALVNYICWAASHYVRDEMVAFPLFTSISFDLTVTSIFVPLITGNTIILYKEEYKDNQLIIEKIIRENKVEAVKLTPSHLQIIRDMDIKGQCNLKRFIVGGEDFKNALAVEISRNFPAAEIYNEYGPTETTVGSMIYRFDPVKYCRASVPIGLPIANTKVYIFDAEKQLVPIGVVGEIYICGAGVAAGYLNRPELTADKFDYDLWDLQDYHDETSYELHELPRIGATFNKKFLRGVQGGGFLKKSPPRHRRQKIYKTGDLGRWLSNCNVEFLGRIDSQVKIRGFRVELGEIENQLVSHEKIKESTVLAREDNNDKYLCAYIVAKPGETNPIDQFELIEYLSNRMPDYMVPPYFVQLDKIPLTPNGKIDRKALPVPVLKASDKYEAPRDKVEKKLVEIWSGILGIEREKIGINDNFFHLGGHSLKATILVSRIYKELGVKVPLTEAFVNPNIRRLGAFVKNADIREFFSIDPVEKKEYYILSSAQRRLLVLQQMDEKGISYNIPSIWQLEGELNAAKFEAVFRKLIRRHESLRTSVHMVNEEPVQRIEEKVIGHWSVVIGEAGKSEIEDIIKNFIKPFDLSRAPLLRVELIKLAHTPAATRSHPSQEVIEHKYFLMVDMHHIISDGMSIGILVREFIELYAGKGLPELRLQYKDYSEWQHQQNLEKPITQQEVYWLKEFAGEIPVLDLPTDYPRPAVQDFSGSSIPFEINKKEVDALKVLANEQGVTLFMLLLSLYKVCLSRFSGQEDIVVGTPIAGRRHADIEAIIGMFVNTLVLRNFPHSQKSFIQFLEEVKENTVKAFENQDYLYEDLVENVDFERDTGRNPLFDTMFAMQNFDALKIEIQGLNVQSVDYGAHISKFDLTLTAVEAGESLLFIFEYCTKLFKKETIRRFITYFKTIAAVVVENPAIQLSEIDILSDVEKKQILFDFNNIVSKYPGDQLIHQLFEAEVEKWPEKIAVGYEGHVLSYHELNRQTHKLAVHLKNRGVKPGMPVGIMIGTCLEMIVGVIAILKAGGGYMPIDPDYPEERIQYMLNDSSAEILLKYNDLTPEAFIDHQKVAAIPSSTLLTIYPSSHLKLAYIIYTSGSTGKPKGVMVEHQNVVRLVKNTNFINFKPGDRILQTGALEFDASTFEIWGALLNSLTLYLVPRDKLLDTASLKNTVNCNHINIIWMTAPLFNQVVNNDVEIFSKLRNLLVGGDVLSPSHINRVRKRFPQLNIINGYGPTENTTFSTTFLIDREYKENIPIGKPIANSTAYIIDKKGHLQPIGIVGELWVGGDGLSMGYMNNSELTAEKFIRAVIGHSSIAISSPCNLSTNDQCPVTNDRSTNDRLYKTGDLARWIEDGNIEYLGRIDQQVKIRGFRVEPAEIEIHLLKHNFIKEAVVIVKKNKEGDKYLCAYITSPKKLTAMELRESLSGELPDYMIPSYFLQLEEIPLTLNGKVDRRALPEPALELAAGEYLAPRDQIEKTLAQLWSDVLGIETNMISIGVDFFTLGGHSLKATLLLAKIHKTFNVSIPLTEIFVNSTIKELAYCIKEAQKSIYAPIEAVELKDYYPVSSAQKRLCVLQQMDEKGIAYNIPSVWQLEGELNVAKLEVVFRKLIHRHESLRTSFHMVNEEPVQRIEEKVIGHWSLVIGEAGESEIEDIIKNFIKPFDLSEASLLRVGLTEINEQKYILMVDMHHIISDGLSMGIFIKEFTELYGENDLPTLKLQYKDYSQWHNRLFAREYIKEQEAYWLKQFKGEVPVLDIPMDYPRPVVQDFAGAVIHFEINKEKTAALKSLAREQDVTLFMLLLSFYTIFLGKVSSQEDIVVGTPIAGRRHADLQGIIGMFVNTLALRNFPVIDKTFSQFLKEIKKNTIKAFENQDYLYEDLVEQVEVERDTGRNPLFDVMFALQNLDTPDVQIPGLAVMPYENESRISKFDLTLIVVEIEERLTFNLEYCTKLFKQETIRRFIDFFKKTVSFILENVETSISGIEIISGEEKNRILQDFNDTGAEYPRDKTIHQLFVEQVQQRPNQVALIGGNSKAMGEGARLEGTRGLAPLPDLVSITYRELNNQSHRLAYILIEKGVKPDIIVGIMLERSIEMIIGILGILKAGGAYLPIDPDYPEERKKYMLKDSNAKILLTRQEIASPYSPQALYLSEGHNFTNDQLAYVIYTSGSTGKPKGVLITHHNICPLLHWGFCHLGLGSNARTLQNLSYSFDWSAWEIFITLTSGGGLYIAPPVVILNPGATMNFIKMHVVTVLHITPTQFQYLLNAPGDLKTLDYLFIGAEKLTEDVVRRGYDLVGEDCRVFNMYGPTEATIISATLEIRRSDEAMLKRLSSVPIGKPSDNTFLLVLDKSFNICPVRVVGELYIGGDGVASGYLNNPELTAEKFKRAVISHSSLVNGESKRTVISSFSQFSTNDQCPMTNDRSHPSHSTTPPLTTHHSPHSPIYRTGDLARWMLDGNIEFLGRIDHQVKIRGFRIELGEIEHQLLTHEKIKETIVIARQDNNDKYLCAYIVAKPGETNPIDQSELREYLSNRLPDYMVPAYFVQIDGIPLTPNGKVDRKALPEPEMKTGKNYIGPGNEIEKKLVDIWSEILEVEKEKIGINDNFFHLGGHSLKAVVLMNRVQETFSAALTIRNVFQLPTITGLAQLIQKSTATPAAEIRKLPEKPYYELSYSQKRLWLLSKMEPRNKAYNLPVKITLYEAVHGSIIGKILEVLITRHESFRTFFKEIDKEPIQVIKPVSRATGGKWKLDVTDWTHLEEKEQERRRQHLLMEESLHIFNLEKWPLFRARLIKYNTEEYDFVLNMHHIITDGWSLEILRQEFTQMYEAYKKGIPYDIDYDKEPLRIQYKDYAAWHNRLLEDEEKMGTAKDFWKNYLSGTLPGLDLPYDFSPGHEKKRNRNSSAYCFVIDQKTTEGLRSFAGKHQGSLFMVLLAGFNLLLSHITGQEEILLAVPAAARQHWELKNIVGMFVNTLILRSRIDTGETFIGLFRAIQANTFDALQYQDFPLELIFSELKMEYPEIHVFFNMVNVGIHREQRLNNLNSYHIEEVQEAKFDMVCYLAEYKNAIRVSCHYFRDLFRPETIEKIMRLFTRILENISKDPGKKAKDYCISPKKKNIFGEIKGLKSGSAGKREKTGNEYSHTPLPGNISLKAFSHDEAAPLKRRDIPIKINDDVKETQERLSKVNIDFMDYVEKNPGCFKLSNFQSLELNDDLFRLQPWPTFINIKTKNQIRQVGVRLFNLLKQIPGRVFNHDHQKMSAFYEIPLEVLEMQLEGSTVNHTDSLVCRGDFILTPTGIKCLEYNVSSNLVGLEIPIWESLYWKTPILEKFFKEYRVETKNENLLGLFLEHALQCSLEKFGPQESQFNIALVMNGYDEKRTESNRIDITWDYLNRLYKEILEKVDNSVTGEVMICDYRHLSITDNHIFLKDKKIHVVQEGYNGVVSPEVMKAFKAGNLCLFNGPITKLLSNKLNLAVLSDPTLNDVFTRKEKQFINAHVPWTRKTSPGPTTYKGKTIKNLEQFMLSHQEYMVIKPALGYGGDCVRLGVETTRKQWEQYVKTALHEKNWVVQELVEGSGGVYQVGDGYGYHDMVWGFFIFGSRYTGSWLRVMPREQGKKVINCHQGAAVSIIFEVDE